MGTCTCSRREFFESCLSPQESLLASSEASLGISAHTVANLVTGLSEVSNAGCISKARFQIYMRIFELNLGSVDELDSPRGKLLREFRRREGFDKEKLSDLMVLLGTGEDIVKADVMFWSRCKGQELTALEARDLMQSLVNLAYIVLPQYTLNSLLTNYSEGKIAIIEKDMEILNRAQGKVLAYWKRKLMAGQETISLAQFRKGFEDDQCKPICSSAGLRQFGRDLSKLQVTL